MRASLVLFAALLATGCATAGSGGGRLEGSRWRVEAINGHPVAPTAQYLVEFKDRRIGGRLGCNHFGGDYRQSGEMLTAGPVAATEMACSEPGMTHEGWGFNILQRPMRMEWHGEGRLILSNEAGSIALARSG